MPQELTEFTNIHIYERLRKSGYYLKARQSEETVIVATMLEQYTCREVVASSGACAIHHTVKAALPGPQGGQIMK